MTKESAHETAARDAGLKDRFGEGWPKVCERHGIKVKAKELGFKDIPVRFFVYDEEAEEGGDIVEVDEDAFLACDYPISYERHSVFANGVKQICLTKCPNF